MNIAFLACPGTLPPTGGDIGQTRRGDAFEHDLQVAALRPPIEAAGGTLTEIHWRAPLAEFAGHDCVLLGTAWDYQDHAAEFLAKLEELQRLDLAVFNPPECVRWNIDKRYLRELADNGVRTIPTIWSDNPDGDEVKRALDHFSADKVVVKRQIGAGGEGQFLFSRDELPASKWSMGHAAMIQPFLPAIKQEGELSLVFIDGEFSHAIRKTAADGEYRIQSLYGGREETITPSGADIAAAGSVLEAFPGDTPLYARIDMVRAGDGGLMLMEAEAIEPYLYPEQGPDLGERITAAIQRRLALL